MTVLVEAEALRESSPREGSLGGDGDDSGPRGGEGRPSSSTSALDSSSTSAGGRLLRSVLRSARVKACGKGGEHQALSDAEWSAGLMRR